MNSGTTPECVHCGGPGSHRHAHTEEYLCCGHAAMDIDAKAVRDSHECAKFYTLARTDRLDCEHRDNPNPPTGDLIPCENDATWRVTTSRFPGDPFDPDHPGAPTATRYCDEHFVERFADIVDTTPGGDVGVRIRD